MSEQLVNAFSTDLREKVRMDVPLIPGAWIEFYDDLTIGQIKKADEGIKEKNMDKQVDLLLLQIVGWNFADPEGKKLPIVAESIEKMSIKLVESLFQLLANVAEDYSAKKKASLSSSSST